jgi:uncharacterized protein
MRLILLLLLLTGCSPAGQDQFIGRDVRLYKDTPVWEVALAIRDNDTIRLKQLLKGQPESLLNYQEKRYGQSLLNWSVYRDSYDAAKVLAEQGADPNLKAYDSTSAFINAADKHDASFLRLLLKHGGDVNAVADTEEPQRIRTPLIAASSISLESVKLLVDAGADADYIRITKRDAEFPGENVESALISAVRAEKIDIVKYLITDVGVRFDYTFNTNIEGEKLGILYYLRRMAFPLDTKEHATKMEVVNFLQKRGLDYWAETVPERFYKNYDSEYLKRY